MKPYIIAHRGNSGHYPENTLLAFRHAIDAGADWIELDVVSTCDDIVVVSHDTRSDRCTDSEGHIPGMTLAQVKKLDAGIRFGQAFAGERIPTLDEALDCTGEKVGVCIEIKGDTQEQFITHARQTVNTLNNRRILNRVIITSFDAECLRMIKTWEPSAVTALDPDKQDGTYSPRQLCEKAQACNANLLLHRYETLTDNIVKECHRSGLNLWTWTVNQEIDMLRMIEIDVDGIMTDYPHLLAQVIRSHK